MEDTYVAIFRAAVVSFDTIHGEPLSLQRVEDVSTEKKKEKR